MSRRLTTWSVRAIQTLSIMVICLTLTPRTGMAQDDAYLTAERFAARARLALVANDPRAGGQAYEQAYQTLADPAYLISAGEAYVSGGLWADAHRVYTILQQSPATSAEHRVAQRGLVVCSAGADETRALISIEISPENASIWMDNVRITTNPPDIWTNAGQHTLRLAHPGYQAKEVIVDALVRRPTLVTIRLTPTKADDTPVMTNVPSTRLRIVANVANANVQIEGRKVGITPMTDTEVAPGLYEIRIVKEGYVTWQRSVAVQGPFPTEVVARLEPMAGTVASEIATAGPIIEPVPKSAPTLPPEPPPESYRSLSTVTDVPPDPDSTSDLVTYGWTAFGIGAAVAVAGGIFQVLAITSATEANELAIPAAGSNQNAAVQYYNSVYVPEHNRLQDEAESRQTIALALSISGGVIAAAGLVAAIVGHAEESENITNRQYSQSNRWWAGQDSTVTEYSGSNEVRWPTVHIGTSGNGAAAMTTFHF